MIGRRFAVSGVAVGIALALPGGVSGQAEDSLAEAEVRGAAASFIDAFNDLDWDRFSASWAQDATAFFPASAGPTRVEGRDEIVGVFRRIFGELPNRAPGPPYLSIEPRDVVVPLVGEGAIVTLHLGDPPTQDRRTLVFTRRGGQWLILHLHASAS